MPKSNKLRCSNLLAGKYIWLHTLNDINISTCRENPWFSHAFLICNIYKSTCSVSLFGKDKYWYTVQND